MARRRGFNSLLLLSVATLVLVGLATLYSAGQTDVPSSAAEIWRRQTVWLGLGIVAGFLAYRISPRILEWLTPAVYVAALLLLVLTLIIGSGAGTAFGTKSWLTIGGVRLGQPAELAKLATILMLARHLGAGREAPFSLAQLLPSLAIVGLPFVLVGLQPDLGSALVFVGILFATLFWAGVRPFFLVLLASPLLSLLFAFSTPIWGAWILVLTVLLLWVRPYVAEGLTVWFGNVAMGVVALELWRRLAPYQQNRLLSFLNPEIDPRATGWHIIQSKVAIGSGGVLGKGFTAGTQKRLAFLPEQHTDFVFSVLGEEFGFAGVVAVLLLFAILLYVLVRVAASAQDGYSSLVVAGVAGMLVTHVFVNIGMTVGLMPIVGIPLPFFSYGGSFLLTCCVAVGLVARMAREGRSSGYFPA
jgi:rod shape determining protein RodA